MITYYLKIAWRSLAKNKAFSVISISGLCLGITCSLLIFLWVKDEVGFDAFHKNGDRLARVMVHSVEKDGSISSSNSSTEGLLAEALKRQVPEVQYAATVVWEFDMLFSVGQEEPRREKGRYVGADFFRMFSFPLMEGNPATALSSPDNIVLTEKLARNYFHGQDPLGKVIRIDNTRNYTVSGVARDVPENSSIRFDFVLPIKHCFDDNAWMVSGWDHFGPDTYVLLRNGADPEKVSAKIRHFIGQQDPQVKDRLLSLQPYKDVYLHSTFSGGVPDGGRIGYVRLFSIVAAFILLIACINFVNMATARALKRAKEIGVRKSVGAMRPMLVTQFLTEALFTTGLAVILSTGLVWLLLPYFNQLTGKHIMLRPDLSFWLTLAEITALTGLVAGSYPALFLSSLNPVSVLKGALKFGPRNTLLRKGLVVVQFTLTIILIVCTVTINKQMHFIENANLGLDRTNILYVNVQGDLGKHFAAFRHDVEASGTVEGMTLISTIPSNVGWYSDNISWEGKPAGDQSSMAELDAGYDFLQTMKVQLAEGRDFSRDFPTDTSNFIVNETAVQLMHLTNPVGTMFSHQGTRGKIIGVVKDFHLASLHDYIAPLFISLQPDMQQGVAAVKIRGSRTKEALAVIEKTARQYNPLFPLDSIFADEAFQQQYQSEISVGRLADVFAVLAIVISCMGLFGVAMSIVEQRTKEIGIRKVLGAGIGGIFGMLSGAFLQPVGMASLLAFPIGWYVMQQWLRGFAYRTPLSWWVFALSAALALLIALLTVSFQVLKAALANPVKSLRTE